jgi:uncharacterized RDD family membrane protein YckC
MRFDEVELEPVPLIDEPLVSADAEADAGAAPERPASWWRRGLALLTDLSLFAALALALSPLLPQPALWTHLASLAGFAIVLSYYYFVGSWMLWGKTIGGAIFDVRRPTMSLRAASMRWAAGLLVLAVVSAVTYAFVVLR